MFDPFDPFDPIEPEPAEETARGASEGAGPKANGPAAAQPSQVEEPVGRAPPARRWAAPAGRPSPPSVHERAAGLPAPAAAPSPSDPDRRHDARARRRLPTDADFQDALNAVLFGAGPASDTGASQEGRPTHEQEPAAGFRATALPDPDLGASTSAALPETDLAAFRTAAIPELEAAVERLVGRGHDASVIDHLTHREPSLVVRFRPDHGPLAGLAASAAERARLELRLAPGLEGETQVVAGYTRGSVGAPLTLLARAQLSDVKSDWVTHRFVEFVQRVLGLG